MIEDKNLSNSALKVLEIYKNLLCENLFKIELLNGFSEDSFFIYLSSLNKIGIKISKDKITSKYFIEENINLLNFSESDFSILSTIKKEICDSNSIEDVMIFNNLLDKIKVFLDKNASCKLQNVIDDSPFGIELHPRITDLQNHIANRNSISILYNTPKNEEKNFILLPLYLKILNSKVYLWGQDSTISELRCLKVDRIISIKQVTQNATINYPLNYAICKLDKSFNINKLNNLNFEIIQTENDYTLIKLYYFNQFELMQKILNYGKDCKVLEPNNLQAKIKETIRNIRGLYE